MDQLLWSFIDSDLLSPEAAYHTGYCVPNWLSGSKVEAKRLSMVWCKNLGENLWWDGDGLDEGNSRRNDKQMSDSCYIVEKLPISEMFALRMGYRNNTSYDSGLSTSIDGDIIYWNQISEGKVFGNMERNKLFCFGEVKSKMFPRHPCSDIEQAIGHMNTVYRQGMEI